jgi:hypothetical protein
MNKSTSRKITDQRMKKKMNWTMQHFSLAANTRTLKMLANVIDTRAQINGFTEQNGASSLFCKFETHFLFRNPAVVTDIWNCDNVKVKLLYKQNGHVPSTNELRPVFTALERVMNTTEMNPEQRFQKLLTASPRHAKVVAFLWNDNNDVQYIVTITVANCGAKRHLIIFVDEYNSNGSACWGSEAKTFLKRAGYSVGGSFDHLFNKYNY